MNVTSYNTITKKSESLYKEKGSKFYGYAFPVISLEDVQNGLDNVKELHAKAGHHCYAYKLGMDDNQYRANDDGEPNGTAGLPILGQIRSFELTNILIVVVRYFGGTKLGVSGLINAYKTTAHDAIEHATIIEKFLLDYHRVVFEYDNMSNIMSICKRNELEIKEQSFEMDCSIVIGCSPEYSRTILEQFSSLKDVKTEYLYTQ